MWCQALQKVALVDPLCVEQVKTGAQRAVVLEFGRVLHCPDHVLNFVDCDLPGLFFDREDAAEHASGLLTSRHLSVMGRAKLNILLHQPHF